ncbi:hypothetical protein ACVIU7_004646 [Bradyrhizobium liaoningense]
MNQRINRRRRDRCNFQGFNVIDASFSSKEVQMIAVRKLPARYAPIVMPFVLSILMTAVVSVISTLRSLGATPAFLATWPGAWALSWLVAFPTLLMVLPLVRRIVAYLVAAPPGR